MINFLIVDDHEIVRAGIKNVVKILYQPDMICEAQNEATAREHLLRSNFELIIMDVQMPNTDPISLINFIHEQHPESKVLMFSMTPEKIYANKFYNAGVMGFVSKGAGLNELTKAIDLALNGRKYFSAAFAEQLTVGGSSNDSFVNPFEKLSSREMQVAKLMMKEKAITAIAEKLSLNPSTLASHKAHIFQKLGINTLAELIAIGNLHSVAVE